MFLYLNVFCLHICLFLYVKEAWAEEEDSLLRNMFFCVVSQKKTV